jgi:CubicO group peptidase (beta-lactamase class C family)
MLRKNIKSGIAIVVAFSMLVIPQTFANAKTAVNYEEVIKLAGQKAEALTSMYGVTSVQYALIDDGEIVVSGQSGVYSKDNKTALTNESMYGIGSISKTFTAAAVMQLVDQGKVNLDQPITAYIPEFKMADKRYKKITVRMLLNHSSGLMGTEYGNGSLFGDSYTNYCDDVLSELATQRLKADPGAFSVYCNDGFTLAQILVEEVSGISFSEYINKYISQPLKLNQTKTPLDKFSRDQLAKTYYIGDKALPVENLSVTGAGGIYSTAEDLCRFSEMFLEDGKSDVLSKTSATAMSGAEYLKGMWAPEADSLLSFGLGFDSVNTYPFKQYGIKAIVKGGDSSFYHGSLIVLPEEGMAMAVLSSGGSSIDNQVFAQEVLLEVRLG